MSYQGQQSLATKGDGDGSLRNRTSLLDVGDSAATDAPPAYGEHHDQFELSQAGFAAGAAVTGKQTPVS